MSRRLVAIEGIRFFGRQRVCQWVAEAIRRVRQQRVAPVASPTGVRKRHRPYFALSEQVALEGHATAWPGRATGRTRQSASLQV